MFQSHKSWEWSFYSQAVAAIPCCFGIFACREEYLNIFEANRYRSECTKRVVNTLEISEAAVSRLLDSTVLEQSHSSFEQRGNDKSQHLMMLPESIPLLQ